MLSVGSVVVPRESVRSSSSSVRMREASSEARFAVAGLLKAALVAVSAVPRTEAIMSKGVQWGCGIGADCC